MSLLSLCYSNDTMHSLICYKISKTFLLVFFPINIQTKIHLYIWVRAVQLCHLTLTYMYPVTLTSISLNLHSTINKASKKVLYIDYYMAFLISHPIYKYIYMCIYIYSNRELYKNAMSWFLYCMLIKIFKEYR